MTKTTYIFVLAALVIGMVFFGIDLIGQPPPPGGYGNHDGFGTIPDDPLNIDLILVISGSILIAWTLYTKRFAFLKPA